jgi:PAS domain-containing protein
MQKEDFDGEPALVTVMHDVTEQRRLEEPLVESDNRYRGMMLVDPETRQIVDSDPAAVLYYGGPNEMEGKNWKAIGYLIHLERISTQAPHGSSGVE